MELSLKGFNDYVIDFSAVLGNESLDLYCATQFIGRFGTLNQAINALIENEVHREEFSNGRDKVFNGGAQTPEHGGPGKDQGLDHL
jgi:hypothetical protein